MALKRSLVSIVIIGMVLSTTGLLNLGGSRSVMAQGSQATENSVQQQRQSRILTRISQLGLTIDDARKGILVSKCQGAQQKVTNLRNRVETYNGNRVQVYATVSSQLNQLEIRLQTQGANITDVSQKLAAFNTIIDDVEQGFTGYLLTLDDLANMNCTDDPTGFQATLQEARNDIEPLREQVRAILQYLVLEVRASFATALAAIEAEPGTGDTGTGE